MNWTRASKARRAAIAASAAIVVVLLAGCGTATVDPPTPTVDDISTGTVRMELAASADGPARQTLEFEDVPAGTTIEDLIRREEAAPMQFEVQGSGSTAFVTSIDGTANRGRSGWLYQVDGQSPSVGVGAFRLQPPATVRWYRGQMD